jgi:SOS regulatory protein LexA
VSTDGQYLSKLQDYYARHRVLPSYSVIGKLVGLNSKASVADMVLRLKAEGFLESTPGKRLKPGRRFFERPFAESVQAGMPSPVADLAPDIVTIDEYLVPHPSKTVLVRVKGDSMIDAGIHADDIVVVEKRTSANVGDIIVAIVDNEFTLKRLDRERSRFVLRPENKAYPVIRPKGMLEIFGVVIGQFRRYTTRDTEKRSRG